MSTFSHAATIQVIIADDHALVRRGLGQILALAPDVEIVAEVGDGLELLGKLESSRCDLVLLDMNMPGLAGAELIARLRRDYPALRILVLSMHLEGLVAGSAIRAGAAGYLTKDSDPEELVAAIRKVAAGGRFIDPTLVETLLFDENGTGKAPHEALSEREIEVFRMLAAGSTVTEIADRLCLSVKTVSTHKARLMRKIDPATTTDVVRYALRHHLIDN